MDKIWKIAGLVAVLVVVSVFGEGCEWVKSEV